MEDKLTDKAKKKKLKDSDMFVQLMTKAKEIKELTKKIKSLCDF